MTHVERVLNRIVSAKEVLWIGKTSTHLWDFGKKVWRSSKDPEPITVPARTGLSVTVIGLISNLRLKLYYHVVRSNNTYTVEAFLKFAFS